MFVVQIHGIFCEQLTLMCRLKNPQRNSLRMTILVGIQWLDDGHFQTIRFHTWGNTQHIIFTYLHQRYFFLCFFTSLQNCINYLVDDFYLWNLFQVKLWQNINKSKHFFLHFSTAKWKIVHFNQLSGLLRLDNALDNRRTEFSFLGSFAVI